MCLAPPTLLRQQPQYVPTTACAPDLVQPYAAGHDAAVMGCFATLLTGDPGPLAELAIAQARLPLRLGGLGLRSATDQRHAAYWASWTDALPAIHVRAPEVAARLIHELDAARCPALQAVGHAVSHLRTAGYNPRGWRETLTEGPPTYNNPEPGDQLRGWQRHATQAAE